MKHFSGDDVYQKTLPQHFNRMIHSHSIRFSIYSIVQNRIVIIKISRISVLSRRLRLWNNLGGAEKTILEHAS